MIHQNPLTIILKSPYFQSHKFPTYIRKHGNGIKQSESQLRNSQHGLVVFQNSRIISTIYLGFHGNQTIKTQIPKYIPENYCTTNSRAKITQLGFKEFVTIPIQIPQFLFLTTDPHDLMLKTRIIPIASKESIGQTTKN